MSYHQIQMQHISVAKLVNNKYKRPILWQATVSMTTIALNNIKIRQTSDSLPTHVPRRNYVHHPLDGRQFGDLFGGSSLRGNPPRRPPFNSHVKWPTFDPCMFMPPWYPSIIAKPTPNYHTRSCNIQAMWKTLTLMLTLEYSRRS